MADYYSQTVIQQPIPITDMTALERLVLMEMFQSDVSDVIDDALYFSHDEGPREMIWLSRADLESAIKASPQKPSAKTRVLIELVANDILKAKPDDDDIEIDITGISWERILQPIIARSKTLSYLTRLIHKGLDFGLASVAYIVDIV